MPQWNNYDILFLTTLLFGSQADERTASIKLAASEISHGRKRIPLRVRLRKHHKKMHISTIEDWE